MTKLYTIGLKPYRPKRRSQKNLIETTNVNLYYILLYYFDNEKKRETLPSSKLYFNPY